MSLSRFILLLLLLAIGIYFFLQMPEAEAYKLPVSIILSNVPTVVQPNEPFRFYATLVVSYPPEIPDSVKQYIVEYGESYIIGEKVLKVLDEFGDTKGSGLTNETGSAMITLNLNKDSNLKVIFDGATILQKAESELFSIRVENQTGEPDMILEASPIPLEMYQNSTANFTIYVESINGYTDTINVSLEQITNLQHEDFTDLFSVVITPIQFTILPNEVVSVSVIVTSSNVPSNKYYFDFKFTGEQRTRSLQYTINVLELIPLQVDLFVSSEILNIGESLEIKTFVSGGIPPYSYEHYINNSFYTTEKDYTYTPTTEGNYSFYCYVTDTNGETVKSDTETVMVGSFNANLYIYNVSSRIDFNGDGVIDETDKNLIESNVGTSNTRYDVNEDGYVDLFDVSIVNGHTGEMVYGEAKIDGSTIWSGTVKNETFSIGKFAEGTYQFEFVIYHPSSGKQETSAFTVNLIAGNNELTFSLSNPWAVSGEGLRLLQLSGDYTTILVLKYVGLLIIILVSTLLLFSVYKRFKQH